MPESSAPQPIAEVEVGRSRLLELALEGLGPLVAFWGVRQLAGSVAGMVAATVAGVVLVVLSRRRHRRGWLPLLTLAFLGIQLVVGLASGSERLYLSQSIAVSVLLGLAFGVSSFTRRPLAGVFAAELYRLEVVVWQQPGYVRTFRLVSLAWASYYLLYAAVRAAALAASVEGFVLVSVVLGLPAVVLLFAWSVRFATRRLD